MDFIKVLLKWVQMFLRFDEFSQVLEIKGQKGRGMGRVPTPDILHVSFDNIQYF